MREEIRYKIFVYLDEHGRWSTCIETHSDSGVYHEWTTRGETVVAALQATIDRIRHSRATRLPPAPGAS